MYTHHADASNSSWEKKMIYSLKCKIKMDSKRNILSILEVSGKSFKRIQGLEIVKEKGPVLEY